MITVYKYPFTLQDNFAILLPKEAEILHVECQGGQPCLWALIDTHKASVRRHFRIFGTGHPIPPEAVLKHIGSFFQHEGRLVWHMFEEIPW